MRLLTGMGSYVPGLVLEAVEGLVAEEALVGSWQVRPFVDALWLPGHHVGHHAHDCHLYLLLLL
jgi:hypothetical protein